MSQPDVELPQSSAECQVCRQKLLAGTNYCARCGSRVLPNVRVVSNKTVTWANQGFIRAQRGEYQHARADYEAAMAANPLDASVLNNFAWLLATCEDAAERDGARAVCYAEQAVSMLGDDNTNALDTLAAAYSEAGRFDDAVTLLSQAIRVAEPAEANVLEIRLQFYRRRQPWRVNYSAQGS